MPKKITTKDRIISSAKDLFYHQGYGATSYGDISVKAGCAKGNVQYYFNTKEEILRATVDLRADNIRASLVMWSNAHDAPLNRLTTFVDMVARSSNDIAKYGCPVGTLCDELGKQHNELQIQARQIFDLYLEWLEGQFERVFSADVSKQYAEKLLTMAQGASLLAHSYNDPELIMRQTREIKLWLGQLFDAAPSKP